MTARNNNRDREVIPMWRRFEDASTAGELSSPRGSDRELPGRPELEEKQSAFSELPGLASAGDLIGAALVAGTPTPGLDAARFVLAHRGASATAKLMADRLLHPRSPAFEFAEVAVPSEDELSQDLAGERLRQLRRHVRVYPRNAVGWVDLAREHALLGNSDRAARAMTAAVGIAPNNRFVIRAAARLFVHIHQPDRAHAIVARADRTNSDPWLMATEIASARVARRRPKLLKAGFRELDRGLPPHHVSELASALATVELEAGTSKRARQLFERSREGANDNVRAQLEWASRRSRINIEPSDLVGSFEAQAYHYQSDGDWKAAVEAAIKWHLQEPFASVPLIVASYVSAIGLRDFDLSAQLAERGLQANPDNPTLLNNVAFALLQLDRVDEAETFVMRAKSRSDEASQTVIRATEGLLLYRKGDREAARRLYDRSMEETRGGPFGDFAALAAIMRAREEQRLPDDDRSTEAYGAAIRLAQKVRGESPAVREWLDELQP